MGPAKALGTIGGAEVVGAERVAKIGEVVDSGDSEIMEAVGVRAKGAKGAGEVVGMGFMVVVIRAAGAMNSIMARASAAVIFAVTQLCSLP
jgi:hypothetical protein